MKKILIAFFFMSSALCAMQNIFSLPTTRLSAKNYIRRSSCTSIYPRAKIICIAPGIVHIKHGLNIDEQIQFSNYILERGDDPDNGFYKYDSEGQRQLNIKHYRGRMFDAVANIPDIFQQKVLELLKSAIHIDPSLRPMEPTHCIMLYYKTLKEAPEEGYISWHKDNGKNDGDEDYPMVHISIGDTAEFLVSNKKPQIRISRSLQRPDNLAHQIQLQSGDVLVTGAEARNIFHAIYEIHENTAPKDLPFDAGRLNCTFRYTPSIAGNEEFFHSKHLSSNMRSANQFFNPKE